MSTGIFGGHFQPIVLYFGSIGTTIASLRALTIWRQSWDLRFSCMGLRPFTVGC